MGPVYGGCPFTRNIEKTLRTSTSFRCRVAGVGVHVSLPLQTIQRSVDSADRNFAARPRRNLLPNSYPVGFLTKTQHGQKDDMLEFTEVISLCHFIYNIE